MPSPAPAPSGETAASPLPRVLVVDDELGVRESLRLLLSDEFDLCFAESGEQALDRARTEAPDAILLDIVLPGIDGLNTLEHLRASHPRTPVIMLTATGTLKTAVRAIKLGAWDFIQKPFEIEELRVVLGHATRTVGLEREVEELRAQVGRRYHLGSLIGGSPPMQAVFRSVERVAPLPTTVLVTGESGTGKELIARALHHQSPRAQRPFVALNCAAIPSNLIESEIFGHERGSFTGAESRKPGQFELAHQGTLFLDEIGELELPVQAKLLRVLETSEFMRVGGTKPVRVDVRIVAATNRDLETMVEDNAFRADLFYRLNVVSIHLPPLRDRREDLPLLLRHFAAAKSRALGMPERTFSAEAVDLLVRHRWPGNVRELENLIERLHILSAEGPIQPAELPQSIREPRRSALPAPSSGTTSSLPALPESDQSLSDAVDDFERSIIETALNDCSYNQTRTADRLRTTRRILKYRMDKLGIRER